MKGKCGEAACMHNHGIETMLIEDAPPLTASEKSCETLRNTERSLFAVYGSESESVYNPIRYTTR